MPPGRPGRNHDLVTAQEIACFAYSPVQWRLQYGLGLEPENRAAIEAGNRHHARKAVVERAVGGSLAVGRLLSDPAMLGPLPLSILTR
jgi:hypothetical protein